MSKRTIGLAVIVTLLAVMATSNVALAARGSPSKPASSAATLRFVQDGAVVSAVAVGTAFEVRGSGFAPGSTVYAGMAGYFDLKPYTVDGSGSFSIQVAGLTIPDSYTYVSLVYSRKAWVIAASATVDVR